MVHYELRGKEVQFAVKIESLTTDAVTGTAWSGSAYGDIVYTKASADNLTYVFFATSVAVQPNGDGVIDFAHDYTVVQDRTTGFVGVLNPSSTLKAGSIIFVNGYFVKTSTDVDAIATNKLSDSPSLGYGTTGDGNVVGSTLNGTKVL